MRVLFLITLVASASFAQGRFDRTNQRTDQGRSNRGFLGGGLAFFEFAPASGAGTGTACACTTPSGARGESMTFTRAGAATCSPLGLATTGITNASLVECAGNLPRIEPSGGVLGIRVESTRTNVLTRFIDYANATWADVGTPTLTGAQASPWTGTYANLAVQFDDNDAVAFEGRTQAVTVTAATAYIMSCYVKAGTLDTARLSLDGTTADFTGLSSTTWSVITVADASSSGVAIAAQALNGSTAAATGTVIWGGCQVEAGVYATSMIPTVAAGVARGVESARFDGNTTISQSVGATFQAPYSTTAHGPYVFLLNDTTASNMLLSYVDGTGALVGQCNQTGALCAANNVSAVQTFPGTHRTIVWRIPTVTWAGVFNGVETTRVDGRAAHPVMNRLYIGSYFSAGSEVDGIVTRVCADPSPSRCR